MRTFALLISLLLALPAVGQTPAAADAVFAAPPSAEAQAWLDEAVASYNEKMLALRRDWLVNVSGARTDFRRRRVIFETANGPVVFDAKSIGGFSKQDEQWLWMWSWASPGVAVNFRLPSPPLHELGTTLNLPFMVVPSFYAKSPDLSLICSAVALKIYGGIGVHRVSVPVRNSPYDAYYLLSNPRRGRD